MPTPEPHDARVYGIRRDVQGADQDAASIADGDPRGQLCRLREHRRHTLPSIVRAHSNEAEWQSFKNNRNNEAFIDGISVIKVPYCLRPTEERKIYEPTFARYPAVSRPGPRLSMDLGKAKSPSRRARA
jgi:hypothetical protein